MRQQYPKRSPAPHIRPTHPRKRQDVFSLPNHWHFFFPRGAGNAWKDRSAPESREFIFGPLENLLVMCVCSIGLCLTPNWTNFFGSSRAREAHLRTRGEKIGASFARKNARSYRPKISGQAVRKRKKPERPPHSISTIVIDCL